MFPLPLLGFIPAFPIKINAGSASRVPGSSSASSFDRCWNRDQPQTRPQSSELRRLRASTEQLPLEWEQGWAGWSLGSLWRPPAPRECSLPNPAPSQPGIPPVRKRRWKIQGKRQTQTPDVLSSRENAPDPALKSWFGEGAEGWNLSGGKEEGQGGSQSAGGSWSHTWSEKQEYQPRWNIPNPSCPDPGVTSGVTNGNISG